jgi:hypothetical protein
MRVDAHGFAWACHPKHPHAVYYASQIQRLQQMEGHGICRALFLTLFSLQG